MNDDRKTKSFWQRQFGIKTTPYQTTFDVIVGLFLPVLCLIFDPFVFRSSFNSTGIGALTSLQIFAYVGICLALFTLALWLMLGESIKSWAGIITGIFFPSALFAFGVGIILIPLTLIGLMVFGVGILGLIPFLTTFAFFRNGRRALFLARQHLETPWLSSSLVFGILFIAVIPISIQWQTTRIISQSVEQAIWGDSESSKQAGENLDYLHTIIPAYTTLQTYKIISQSIQQYFDGTLPVTERDIQRLKHFGWCVIYFDKIVRVYGHETNPGQRHVLATIYADITEKDIEDRWWQLRND